MKLEVKNYIHIALDEYEINGKHEHNIVFAGEWKDSNHFLEMLALAFEKWRESFHSSK